MYSTVFVLCIRLREAFCQSKPVRIASTVSVSIPNQSQLNYKFDRFERENKILEAVCVRKHRNWMRKQFLIKLFNFMKSLNESQLSGAVSSSIGSYQFCFCTIRFSILSTAFITFGFLTWAINYILSSLWQAFRSYWFRLWQASSLHCNFAATAIFSVNLSNDYKEQKVD